VRAQLGRLVGEVRVRLVAERERRNVAQRRLERVEKAAEAEREPAVVERDALEVRRDVARAAGDEREIEVEDRAGLTQQTRGVDELGDVVLPRLRLRGRPGEVERVARGAGLAREIERAALLRGGSAGRQVDVEAERGVDRGRLRRGGEKREGEEGEKEHGGHYEWAATRAAPTTP